MSRAVVTPAHFEAIRTAQRSGESMRSVAARLGLDRRTVDRAAKRLPTPKPSTTKATKATTSTPSPPDTTGDITHLESLKNTAAVLRALVDGDLPPRDVCAAAKELREHLVAIRRLEAPIVTEDDAADVQDSAARVRAKLEAKAAARTATGCAHCAHPEAASLKTGTE